MNERLREEWQQSSKKGVMRAVEWFEARGRQWISPGNVNVRRVRTGAEGRHEKAN